MPCLARRGMTCQTIQGVVTLDFKQEINSTLFLCLKTNVMTSLPTSRNTIAKPKTPCSSATCKATLCKMPTNPLHDGCRHVKNSPYICPIQTLKNSSPTILLKTNELESQNGIEVAKPCRDAPRASDIKWQGRTACVRKHEQRTHAVCPYRENPSAFRSRDFFVPFPYQFKE